MFSEAFLGFGVEVQTLTELPKRSFKETLNSDFLRDTEEVRPAPVPVCSVSLWGLLTLALTTQGTAP